MEDVRDLEEAFAEEQRKRHAFREWLNPEIKAEFILGEVVLHSPNRVRHNAVRDNLHRLVDRYNVLRRAGLVTVEKALCEFTRNDFMPDIVFFGRTKADLLGPDDALYPVPDLVVEVLSKSTAKHDRGVKFEDYAAHGVGEYWLVDPDRALSEQYVLRGAAYALANPGNGEVVSVVLAGLRFPAAAASDDLANRAAVAALGA